MVTTFNGNAVNMKDIPRIKSYIPYIIKVSVKTYIFEFKDKAVSSVTERVID